MKLRRTLWLMAVAMALVAVVWVVVDYQTRPRLVTGPMVQLLEPDGFTLAWQAHPQRPMRVLLEGLDGAPETEVDAELRGGRHVAVFTGLKPATQYQYTIMQADPRRSAFRSTVRTAPPPGAAFRILALGDTGDGRRPQWSIARQIGRWSPDVVIHTGDVVYSFGKRENYPERFFAPYADLIARVPIYPCLGNHDVRTEDGAPYMEVFILPPNGPPDEPPGRNYWFDFGDVRFVSIDSNLHYDRLSDVVAPWLDGVLADAGERWKILFFHEPIYTHGRYPEAEKLKRSIAPLLDAHNVELVLAGHNHLYERTHPIRGGQIAPDGDGAVHITTGAGGARLYKLRANPPEYLAAWHDTSHSFTIIDVTTNLMALRQIDAGGRIIDEHHLPRRLAAPAPTPPDLARIPS